MLVIWGVKCTWFISCITFERLVSSLVVVACTVNLHSMARIIKTVEERFHSKYVCNLVTGCWDWVACIHWRGYGIFNDENNKACLAHRYSYKMRYSVIMPDMFVMHTCDNRACVNPEHLMTGDHRANMADMVAKCRSNTDRRDYVGKSSIKMTNKDMVKVYKEYVAGTSWYALGKKYGMSQYSLSERCKRMLSKGLLK